MGGPEETIWECVSIFSPQLQVRASRLCLDVGSTNRAMFIGLWFHFAQESGVSGIGVGRLLEPVFDHKLAARYLMQTYTRLTTGPQYQKFRSTWQSGNLKSTDKFVDWLQKPAFSEQIKEIVASLMRECESIVKQRQQHQYALSVQGPCPEECGCDNAMDSSFVQKRAVANKGYGVFAVMDIEKDQWLGPYLGVRRSVEDLDQNGHGQYVIQFKDGKWALDGCANDCIAHFVNHECKHYNAEFAETTDGKSINLRALRSIAAGEEVTVNYGPGFKINPCFCSFHQGRGASFGVKK